MTDATLPELIERRRLLAAGLVGTLAASGLSACSQAASSQSAGKTSEHSEGEGISAVEDLMREHGVLRRILIVYSETAPRLLSDPGSVDVQALAEAASLFRAFGEDYHERQLEERFLFPELKRSGGEAGGLIDTLLAQHQRGREITDYILATVQGGSVASGEAERLAGALQSMNRMYEAHAAFEDTIVFPAWKETVPSKRLEELAEKFEEIEHEQFGEDGFDEAVRRVRSVEQRLKIGDLGDFTAPATGGNTVI